MTVPSTASEVSYATDGVTVAFAIPFVFDTSADVFARLTDASGTITPFTAFSVAGGSGSTGTLTTNFTLASGYSLTIFDDPERSQDTDYDDNDAFPADAHERALDKQTRLSKRLWQLIQRCLRTSDGDPITDLTLGTVDNRKGKYLFFNAVTGAIEYAVNLVTTALSQSIIGQLLNPQTAAEAAAGTTPTDYAYGDRDERRYGAPALNLHDYAQDGEFNLMGFIPQNLKSTLRARTSTVDISTYLQDAIDAVESDRTYGTVRIPAGRFYCETGLTAKTGVCIKGAGYFASDIVLVGNIVGVDYTPVAYTETGITLEDFSIRGLSALADDLIQLGNCTWVHLNRMRLRDTAGSCIRFMSSGLGVLHTGIYGSIFESFAQYGVEITSLGNLLQIDRAQVNANAANGIAFLGVLAGLAQFRGNNINCNGNSLLDNFILVGSGGALSDSSIDECYAELMASSCIKASGTGIVNRTKIHGGNYSGNDSVQIDLSNGVAHEDIIVKNCRNGAASVGHTFFHPGSAASFETEGISVNAGNRVFGYTTSQHVKRLAVGVTYVDGVEVLRDTAQVTSGTTVDVTTRNMFEFSHAGATTVTSFTGGRAGQIVVCRFANGNTALQNSGSPGFRLAGAVNFTGTALDTITLVNVGSNVFVETARSVN